MVHQRSSTITAAAATDDKEDSHSNMGSFDSTSSSISPSSCLKLHYLDETTSTQDEARRWLSEFSQQLSGTTACEAPTTESEQCSSCCLAVMARQQSQGRGTSGRTWLSQRGNLFLTVAIPQTDVPVPLTLLPLQVGIIVARRLDFHLRRRLLSHSSDSTTTTTTIIPSELPRVTVKWPNDVLVNQQKIAGVLIENHYVPAACNGNTATSLSYWFLVGIGVNVRHAPSVPSDGPQRGRPSTSLYEQFQEQRRDDIAQTDEDEQETDDDLARLLGREIAQDLVNWIYYQDTAEQQLVESEYAGSPQALSQQRKQRRAQQVVDDWKMWAGLSRKANDFNNNNQIQYTLRETGEVVQVVDLEPDGQLRVWHAASRQERVLAADYLY